MKNVFLLFPLFICLLIANFGLTQLKVDNSGLVGIGTTSTSPWYNLYLGNTSKDGLLHTKSGSHFRAGQSDAYSATVGTSSDRINFWYGGEVNYNVVKYQYAIEESDSTSKENIIPLRNGMDKLLLLKTYSYDFIDEADDPDRKKSFGFLAQEINEILPDLTDTSHGIMGIKTTQLIPFLVDGTQELYYQNQVQNTLLDSLVRKVVALENELYGGDPMITGSVLYQNEPNPFKENTVIRYELPAEYSTASIMLFNMNGAYINQYELFDIGIGELTIEAETLEAGMYLYSLIVDDQEVDTKRLILQQ